MDRRVLLLAAVVLTGGGLYGFLNSQNEASESELIVAEAETVTEDQQPVWVAAVPLKKGELITAKKLKLSSIPESEAELLGLVSEEPLKLVKGSLAGEGIAADSVITEELLVTPDEEGYVALTLKPGMVPYPIELPEGSAYHLILSAGDRVDVVLISSLDENLANTDDVDSFDALSVAPLLKSRRILKVNTSDGLAGKTKVDMVLELSRREVSQILLARRVGVLDIYKSTREQLPQVRSGDVLPDFSPVRELRGKPPTS